MDVFYSYYRSMIKVRNMILLGCTEEVRGHHPVVTRQLSVALGEKNMDVL